MRLTATSTWRDPRVLAWFLAVFSSTLVASALIGDLSAIGDLLLSTPVAVGTTLAFASASAEWPENVPPWRTLVPIFVVEFAVVSMIWVLIRT